jgi:hypothetical protein
MIDSKLRDIIIPTPGGHDQVQATTVSPPLEHTIYLEKQERKKDSGFMNWKILV